jgi:hypothetical protein
MKERNEINHTTKSTSEMMELKFICADSIAAELLKNGGSQLVDALEEVIQLAWTGETLPEIWAKGVLCVVYKKGDKLDCTNNRGICLLNVAYKVFAKVL